MRRGLAWRAPLFALACIAVAGMGFSHTLPQNWTFAAGDASSLAVFDYPLVSRDAPFSFNSFNLVEVHLDHRTLGARRYVVGGVNTPRQLRPDLGVDDGSLMPLERTAQQTLFVPYPVAPGDYAITGGVDVRR